MITTNYTSICTHPTLYHVYTSLWISNIIRICFWMKYNETARNELLEGFNSKDMFMNERI